MKLRNELLSFEKRYLFKPMILKRHIHNNESVIPLYWVIEFFTSYFANINRLSRDFYAEDEKQITLRPVSLDVMILKANFHDTHLQICFHPDFFGICMHIAPTVNF